MIGADQVLKDSGREAFFSPLIGSGLNKVLPKNDLEKWKEMYNNSIKDVGTMTKENKTIIELINNTDAFKDLNSEDKEEYVQALKQNQIYQ